MATMVPVRPGPMMATRISAIRISGNDQVRSTTVVTARSNNAAEIAGGSTQRHARTAPRCAMAMPLTDSEVRAP